MEDGRVKAGVRSVERGAWSGEWGVGSEAWGAWSMSKFPGIVRRPVPSITGRMMQIGGPTSSNTSVDSMSGSDFL